ncbi:MAG: hypothetical protein F6K18_16845 [Okeania sp. SIO2C2]|uniref:hypothetical protein n=1 Tax=Okeania sp. SIO2C2 TaxID=2607787 RepID=UPI0013BB09DA|nr:hypothetical protein [Okeania sp. SIO2C2]NEP88360.1 hypothetical protein [Okeania sp. SIO2C2]
MTNKGFSHFFSLIPNNSIIRDFINQNNLGKVLEKKETEVSLKISSDTVNQLDNSLGFKSDSISPPPVPEVTPKFCSSCGAKLRLGNRFCNNFGTKIGSFL